MYYCICPLHGAHMRTCRECSPKTALTAALRKSLRGALLRKQRPKISKSLDYLGLDSWDMAVEMLLKKVATYNKKARVKIVGLKFDIDHIKPVSAFGDKDLHLCHHWTNLQPLPPKLNRSKSGKWNQRSEDFWKRNIILNKHYDQIFLPFTS